MSFQHDHSAFHGKQIEVQFNCDEVLCACTDETGVITAGNSAFERVSGFDWGELEKAPHSLLRHPDMPKGMFHHIWSVLQSGKSVAAYILNQSKTGDAYWVFCVMAPIEGGYLSMSFKPSSDIFDAVRQIYSTALEQEKAGLSAQDSSAHILSAIQDLGYVDYANFEAQALGAEGQARDKILGRVSNKLSTTLTDMSTALMALGAEQEKLFGFFKAIRGIPSNMRIVASRLEPAGGPISAISQNYRLMSDEVHGHLKGFKIEGEKETVSAAVSARVQNVVFLVSASALFGELSDTLMSRDNAVEGGVSNVDVASEAKALRTQFSKDAVQALNGVSRDVVGLARSSKDMRQLVAGLDSIRVLCRVEAGRLGANSVSLTPVIDQLDKFHKEIDRSLEQILFQADKISSCLETVMKNSAMVSASRLRR
ncbi:aerotaxis receptor [Pacificibacter maritimus]|uniref:Aerotaxis receptor n=1 Tax=Pacificibacter maritimus TaxID=762213 RepID=A0A3N4U8W9_9RHOB|nr:PAS domain-containing protein [Pacificibacter maritimus]RPE66248.1 aerotaxis receptor [Pacificibacter maritimus]